MFFGKSLENEAQPECPRKESGSLSPGEFWNLQSIHKYFPLLGGDFENTWFVSHLPKLWLRCVSSQLGLGWVIQKCASQSKCCGSRPTTLVPCLCWYSVCKWDAAWSDPTARCDWEAKDRTACWGKGEKYSRKQKNGNEILGQSCYKELKVAVLVIGRAAGRAWLENYTEAGGDNITSKVGPQGQKHEVNGNIFLKRE